MPLTKVISIGCLFAICSWCPGGDGKREKEAELKWANSVAKDFWDALHDCDYDAAVGLLSPELSRAMAANTGSASSYLQFYMVNKTEVSVRSQSEELAPDRSEVVIRGVRTSKEFMGDAKMTEDFTLRIAKGSSGGAWSIRFLRLKLRETTEGEDKKP
jgi:hypothetical protein